MPTPRALNGVHWSNGAQWSNEQALRVAGPTGAVTLLHFQLFPETWLPGTNIRMTGEDENCLWYGKMRQGFPPQGIPPMPELFIHVRVYHPFSLSVDPGLMAERVADQLAHWRGSRDHADLRANLWDDPFLGVSSGNELNLHHENGDPAAGNQWQYQTVDHYKRVADWDMRFWDRIDQLVPQRKALRVSPAFADGHEPLGYPADGEYTIPEVRAMLEASDLVGIHPYAILHEQPESGATGKQAYWYMLRPFRPVKWETAQDLGGVVRQYPHKRFLVSESGTFTHSVKDPSVTAQTYNEMMQFLRVASESQQVCGVTWFIWNQDGAHARNSIWQNDELRWLLEHMPRWPAADLPVATTSPVPPPHPSPGDPPMPEHQSNPHGYVVGDGFLKKADELGWTLLSDEMYHDPQQPDAEAGRGAWSEAFCDQGRLYWHAALPVEGNVIAVPFA